MKKIPLSKGKFALVDDKDYPEMSKYKWYAWFNGRYWYARRYCKVKNKTGVKVFMHRQILGLELGDKRIGDHKDHCTLDNRRKNLRICTRQQNAMNIKSNKYGTSKYKGVCWDKRYSKWKSEIMIDGKHIFLGYFKSEIESAQAYNKAAKKYFREFASLNIIEDSNVKN